MESKKIAVAVGILLLVIVGMFIFTYLKKSEIERAQDTEVPGAEETESPYGGITRIDAKHFYIAPTHTIVGEIPMPTPCDLLNWDTRIQESMPETAVVSFDVVNHAEVCAQVITPQRFRVSFDASENAAIRAELMGRQVELNLIPGGPGETPDDFELFIKG